MYEKRYSIQQYYKTDELNFTINQFLKAYINLLF